MGGAPSLPPFPEAPCYGTGIDLPAPSGVPLDKAINALSDAEATAWCQWMVAAERGDGPPPPRTPPFLTNEGYPAGYAMRWCGFTGRAVCASFVPVDLCVKMLRLGDCPAPMRALEECYLSTLNSCEPVGGGCSELAARPECHQTFVQVFPGRSSVLPGGCPVPVK